MNWHIKPFSHRCFISGEPFEDGERYTSHLVADQESGELIRFDVSEAAADRFQAEGEVICRWSRVYKREPERGASARQQRETAESVFVSLFESDDAEEDAERETLKQVLGVFLERKKVLKDRGFHREGAYQILEHRKNGNVFLVPTDRMTPEFLPRIREKLGELMG